jgi:hypothetical protein
MRSTIAINAVVVGFLTCDMLSLHRAPKANKALQGRKVLRASKARAGHTSGVRPRRRLSAASAVSCCFIAPIRTHRTLP